MPSSTQREIPGRHLRIDTEHQVLEMMKNMIGHLRNHDVRIQLNAESVLLTGHVDSWSDKQMAQERIRSMLGNRTINNDLNVAAHPDKT